MFSSPGGQGSCSWSLTGNRCGRGRRRGKVEGSQGMDAVQVRAQWGAWGEGQAAGEVKEPLSTTGGWGVGTPSPPLRAPPPASPPVISLREKGQVRSTWSPGEGPCESRVQLKGKCALNSTQGRRGFWTGISDLLRNWQEIRNQDTMSPLNCHPWPQTLDMFLQYQAYPMGHQACPGTARPRSPPSTPLACGPGDPCPLDCLGQF